MKKLIIIIISLYCTVNVFAQNTEKLNGFKQIVLPEYNTYFNDAVLNEGNLLELQATEKYFTTNFENKKGIIYQMLTSWQDSLLLISHDSKRELWGLSTDKGKVKMIDQWDYSIKAVSTTTTPILTTVSRPWFVYIGGQFGGDNQSNINLGINLRLGFFLLMNRWDMATTFSGGIMDNTKQVDYGYGTTSSSPAIGYTNFGIMSRVHFPIKRTGFSPNIGAEISMSKYGDTEATVTPSFVIGFSWFVGIGSIDIGVKIGEITSGMGGYTMYPAAKR